MYMCIYECKTGMLRGEIVIMLPPIPAAALAPPTEEGAA